MAPAGRQCGYDDLRLSIRAEIASVVGETHDRICVCHVDPLGITAAWIKGDAKRQLQAGCKHLILADLIARVGGPQDTNPPGQTLGDEDISVRRYTNKSRLNKAAREKTDFEAGNDF